MHSHAHSSHAPEGQRHASIRGHLSPHSPHHGHIKVADEGNQRKIRLAIFLTTGYMLVEVVGGYLSNSVALMADAAHMLTDAVALMLAWWGFY
ncbi:MAG: cation transporter, partial [Moraxella osloensis]|nr:cation transporter [Moraxella osloensis]